MPVQQFFAMRRAGYDVEARWFAEMTDVMAVSFGGMDYYKTLRRNFWTRFTGQRINERFGPVIDVADPESGKMLGSIFKEKMRLMGHG